MEKNVGQISGLYLLIEFSKTPKTNFRLKNLNIMILKRKKIEVG